MHFFTHNETWCAISSIWFYKSRFLRMPGTRLWSKSTRKEVFNSCANLVSRYISFLQSNVLIGILYVRICMAQYDIKFISVENGCVHVWTRSCEIPWLWFPMAKVGTPKINTAWAVERCSQRNSSIEVWVESYFMSWKLFAVLEPCTDKMTS